MIDQFLKVIDSLPKVAQNWRALFILIGSGLFVGVTGIPLWIIYRNEGEVLQYIFSLNQRKVEPYPRQELLLIRSDLQDLLKNSDSNRAIFGIIEDGNRLILVEAYRPLEEPLPLGFQTVYLETEDYQAILNTLRLSNCVYLKKENVGSYFQTELEISNAVGYLTCPSESNWFLATYLTSEEDIESNTFYLQETVKKIETILNLTK
jgi:hypothetical protein